MRSRMFDRPSQIFVWGTIMLLAGAGMMCVRYSQLNHKMHAWCVCTMFIRTLWSPNEDFGRSKKHVGPCFQSTFIGRLRPTNSSFFQFGFSIRKVCFVLIPLFFFLSSKFMLPKRRFWTAEQSVACAFLKFFSRVWVLLLGYHWLKTRSKTHTQNFVQPSKIFVWGA